MRLGLEVGCVVLLLRRRLEISRVVLPSQLSLKIGCKPILA